MVIVGKLMQRVHELNKYISLKEKALEPCSNLSIIADRLFSSPAAILIVVVALDGPRLIFWRCRF